MENNTADAIMNNDGYTHKKPPVSHATISDLFDNSKGTDERELLRALIGQTTRVHGMMLIHGIYHMDRLATRIHDGGELAYASPTSEWTRNMQKLINWTAHPSVGLDRVAIALGCFRDAVTTKDLNQQWEDLAECRAQMVDFYNTITPNPFVI